jgi:hypothetical protein
MGAWGAGVFSDDTACDVRDNYLDLIGDGMSGVEATKKLLHEWSGTLDDPDEGPVFWLALAATQWKNGRLEDLVLQRALIIIDSGTDLARWEANSRNYKARQKVLENLRAQLTSPQPPEKRISKRFRHSNDWPVGDLISYQLVSRRLVLFRVIGHHSDKGGTAPICELLDWVGDKLPKTLVTLGVRSGAESRPGHPLTQLMIGRARAKERPDDRLCQIGVNLKPSQKPSQYTVTLWRHLDAVLKKDFGIE